MDTIWTLYRHYGHYMDTVDTIWTLYTLVDLKNYVPFILILYLLKQVLTVGSHWGYVPGKLQYRAKQLSRAVFCILINYI